MAMRMMAGQCPDGMGRLLSNVLYLLMKQGAAATLLALQLRPRSVLCATSMITFFSTTACYTFSAK